MNRTCVKVIIAFIVGNLAQIVFAIVAKVSYMSRPILFGAAAGVILLAAILAGIYVANLDKPPEPKTYREYADIE